MSRAPDAVVPAEISDSIIPVSAADIRLARLALIIEDAEEEGGTGVADSPAL